MEFTADSEVAKRFSWVTQLNVDASNVANLLVSGRSRWKIENETFNTLKNQGLLMVEINIKLLPKSARRRASDETPAYSATRRDLLAHQLIVDVYYHTDFRVLNVRSKRATKSIEMMLLAAPC
jgi:hypothetical protein